MEDYLVFGYSDDSAFVWQMQTAHLDRVLHGESARDVLKDDRWPLNRISSTTIQKSGGNSSKQTVSIRSIMSNDNGKYLVYVFIVLLLTAQITALHTSNSFAQVFTFNIRRLVHDLYSKVSLLAGTKDNRSAYPILKPSVSSSSYDAVVPDILTFRPDKDDPLDISSDQHVGLGEDVTSDNEYGTRNRKELRDKKMELIAAVVSTIASWNINEAFEEICCNSLKLSKGINSNISFGLKGYVIKRK